MDSSLRRCLSKALLESGKKLTGRLPVTLMLAYNVPRYFQRCHRHAGDASSWPRRRGNDSGTTILVKMALNGARRESLCKIRAMNKFRTRVFFLWIIRMFFFFLKKFIEERNGEVMSVFAITRWEFSLIETYLLIRLTFFFLLLLLLFRVYHYFWVCQG